MRAPHPSRGAESGLAAPFALSLALAALLGVQAVAGLVFSEGYRDAAWIRAAWFGNDLVTLLVAAPALVIAIHLARRGAVLGYLLWLGLLGYATYNGAFYLLGAALNVYFPLYVMLVLLAAAALILALARLPIVTIAEWLDADAPVRIVGGYLAALALALGTVWMVIWAGYAFAGRPTPIEPEAFKLVAALDMTLMVPPLALGGLLLWRRRPWGVPIAAVASVQATLYLVVLTVGSVVSVLRGLVAPPGEILIWGALALLTGTVTAWFLSKARGRPLPSVHDEGPFAAAVVDDDLEDAVADEPDADVRYYDFRIEGRPVGYVEVVESARELAMTATMVIDGVGEVNAFRVALEEGVPVRYRAGDGPWTEVPEGSFPSTAFPLVLRERLQAYRSIDEETGRSTDVDVSYDGDTATESVDGAVRRRFRIADGALRWIDWGGGATSELRSGRAEAVEGTEFANRPT